MNARLVTHFPRDPYRSMPGRSDVSTTQVPFPPPFLDSSLDPCAMTESRVDIAELPHDSVVYALPYGPDAAVQTAAAALSEPHPPSDHDSTFKPSVNGRKRKATGVPGSRGVANLTPDQLTKKRANDREAQRAIRERTRSTIEGLERRIHELESQQPFQDLQRVVAERDRARAECEELRRRLAAVAGIVGDGLPHPGANGSLNGEFTLDDPLHALPLTSERDTELAALTAQQSPLPPLPLAPAESDYDQQQYLHPDLRSPHASPVSQTSTLSSTFPPGEGARRKRSPHKRDMIIPNQQYRSRPNSLASDPQRPQLSSSLQGNHMDRFLESYTVESPHHKSDLNASAPSYTSPPVSSHHEFSTPNTPRAPESPVWARTPANCPATCPLDSLLGDFIVACRRQLQAGIPKHELLGSDRPFWVVLTAAGNMDGHIKSHHPVANLLVDILSKFPDISRLAEQVAVIYTMSAVLRWHSCPCKDCFDMVPDYIKPTPLQIEQPHALWYDYLPW